MILDFTKTPYSSRFQVVGYFYRDYKASFRIFEKCKPILNKDK